MPILSPVPPAGSTATVASLASARAPRVIVSLREIDLADLNANIHRISVRAENVGRQGFDLYFATWLESQVYGAVASWTAVSD